MDRPARQDRRPEPAHGEPSLAVLLVLSQWAVGAVAAGRAGLGLALVVVASLASILHLGRPLLAWRAVLGWRHSWLSREVIALGLFSTITVAAAALGNPPALRLAATAAGLTVVFSSAAIYAVTCRRWWRPARLIGLFGATAVVAALVAGGAPVAALAVAALAKLAIEGEVLRRRGDERGELSRTARLLAGPLSTQVGRRLALLVVGLGVLAVAPPLGAALLVAGDLVERGLLFRAVSPDKMP